MRRRQGFCHPSAKPECPVFLKSDGDSASTEGKRSWLPGLLPLTFMSRSTAHRLRRGEKAIQIDPLTPSYRANWRSEELANGKVILFDDDRHSFASLWVGLQKGWFTEPPLLIRIDKHHDCKPISHSAESRWSSFAGKPTHEDIWSFVEWELDFLDGDWVSACAHAGLIRGVISFYVGHDDRNECNSLPNGIPSFTFGSLSNCLSYQGPLVDLAKASNKAMWETIGWDHEQGRFGTDGRPYAIAIDLDAFTTSEEKPTLAWPAKWFEDELQTPHSLRYSSTSAADVLREAVNGASLTIVAREPSFCGGELEVAKILQVLDRDVFGGQLRV